MVTVVEGKSPLAGTLMRLLAAGPVHPTGTVSLMVPRVRVTVGWLGSLLHSRIAPELPPSKPDPVTVTFDPPLRHVPGFTVRLGVPDEVVDFAVQGTVVVVLAGAVVVVVVAAVVLVVVVEAVVVVVPPPDVVVVVPPPEVVVVVVPP